MGNMRKFAALLTAFILTVCVLGLGPLFLLIECNIRQTVYGQADPNMAFSLEEGRPTLTHTDTGQAIRLLTDREWQGVSALLPPGIRATLVLLQQEADGAVRLWTWVEQQQPLP
ncbi:MAG: hypothetical protein IJ518_01360 [Clostridia bacterium]|nr:hypothetical protein [Clostridia bacterium]